MIKYLKFIVLVIFIGSCTPRSYVNRYLPISPQSLPIESMQRWEGSTVGLTWLNPESYGSSFDGPTPVQRWGALIMDSKLYDYLYDVDYNFPADGLELLDGWRVMPNRIKGCTQYEIRLQSANGREALFTVELHREGSYFDHSFLTCIGDHATVYYVVVVNAKYVAFRTSEPGWVFFDRISGKFLNTIASDLGNCGLGSNLFRTTSGQMLIEYAYVGTRIQSGCSASAGLYIFGDPAPVLTEDMSRVLALNHSNYCRLEKLRDRICKPGGKYGDTGISINGGDVSEDKTGGLKGIDEDNNGIRDDIDRLIAKKYSATPAMKKAVEQSARALQKFMQATTTPKARIASAEINRASSCVAKIFLNGSALASEEQLLQIGNDLRALTRNTQERTRKYENSNRLASEAVFDVPREPVCD